MTEKKNIPSILTEPNPILRKRADEVPAEEIQTARMKNIIQAMKEALKRSDDGVGIAAPQIGHSIRIFLISEEAETIDQNQEARMKNQEVENNDQEKKEWDYYVFINPVITKFSTKKADMAEGCLSVPGIFGMVRRPAKVTVEWLDEFGKKRSRGCSKFFARVIQHETDHINGILFIDKMHKRLDISKSSSRL